MPLFECSGGMVGKSHALSPSSDATINDDVGVGEDARQSRRATQRSGALPRFVNAIGGGRRISTVVHTMTSVRSDLLLKGFEYSLRARASHRGARGNLSIHSLRKTSFKSFKVYRCK